MTKTRGMTKTTMTDDDDKSTEVKLEPEHLPMSGNPKSVHLSALKLVDIHIFMAEGYLHQLLRRYSQARR